MRAGLQILPASKKSAFSLVELSIVLVILGLLIGGILSGQALIRAAELRSINTDISRYAAAINTFRDKYFALPGDMTNATAFWGKDNANCSGQTGTAATPGTCNGNGDGMIDATERFRFWQQLANAGLVEGNYTGTSTGGVPVAGTNIARSKYNDLGWDNLYYSKSSYGWTTDTNFANHLRIGLATSAMPYTDAYDPNQFTAEDMWNIDTKMDDGTPGGGKMFARVDSGCQTTNVIATAVYALNVSGKICGLNYFY
jgi:prepilin-type N-terminal cleavage/methylation domain-containing protein